MESAEQPMDECITILSQAYGEAEEDLDRQRQRVEKDHTKLSEEALQELAKQAVEIIATEKEELSSIEAHCTQDIASIEDGLGQLQQHMDRARDDYTREERSKLEELERNKRRQRELEDELRMLKARENQLRDEVAEGKELQQKVDEVQEKEAEKKKAAQTGFARKVNDLTRDLDNCHQDRLMYEMKRDMHSSELETLIAKLKSIDSDFATLRPQLELDSLKGRYTRFKQAKDQAFEKLNGVLDYSSVFACRFD
eukprot:Em0001g2597a